MMDRELPNHWTLTRLSNQQLFSFENGIWKGKKTPLEECAVVRNTNFTRDGYLDLAKVAVLQIEQKHLAKKKLKWGDILIERSGGGPKQPVGRVVFFNLNEGKYCFSNFTSRLRIVDKAKANPFYLFFYLLYFYDSGQTRKLQHGTTGIRNLSFESYKDVRIPLPPLPEQRAIASVLGAIQEAKFARQKEIALERERKAALMDYLFSHGAKGEPRKQTEIGEIPESWEVLKLGQLCRVFSGHGFKTKDYTQEGIPLIKIGNLQDGEVVINPNNDYMPELWQQQEQLQKFILKSKDILIALTGATTGKTAVVPSSLEGTFLNQRVGKIELISPNAEQDFILVVIKTRLFQEAIQQNILRSAQGNISPSSIAQIPIPLPLPPEQRTIASVFQAIDGKTASLKEEAEHLDELSHAALEELMTGKRSAIPLIDAEFPN